MIYFLVLDTFWFFLLILTVLLLICYLILWNNLDIPLIKFNIDNAVESFNFDIFF
jgi:HAMP domain-containing protein